MTSPADWFVRCPAVHPGDDTRPPEQCAFPAIDSPAGYMHGDEHETLTWIWGHREVAEAKEARR